MISLGNTACFLFMISGLRVSEGCSQTSVSFTKQLALEILENEKILERELTAGSLKAPGSPTCLPLNPTP